MNSGGTIRLATRGSDLALRQAASVEEELGRRRYDVDIVEVETTGDQIRDELIHRLGKIGAFVRSLDEAVLDGDVDLAVHSMKDMPTESPDDLVVVATPERAQPGDVLVTAGGGGIDDLPMGATVGTASLRRKAQLLNARPDLDVQPIRGNVDTRVEKLLAPQLQAEHEERSDEAAIRAAHAEGKELPPHFDEGDVPREDDYEFPYEMDVEEWFDSLNEIERRALERDVDTDFDALVMAEAGIRRSGLDHHVEYERLPVREFVPAPGQGALAITGVESELTSDVQRVLDHPRTRAETTVERTVLAELGGGCIAPVGVYAVVQGEYVHTTAQVLATDGSEVVEATRDVPIESHAHDARAFARDLADRGAADLVAAAQEDAETEASRED
jgi:hydroxymethylbilane synthase